MERRQRRHRRERGAAAADAAAAAALPAPAVQDVAVVQAPFRLQGPILDPRSPMVEEIFASTWGLGNRNYLHETEKVGRQYMPLPAGAPAYEATFFEFRAEYKTNDDLANLLMKMFYDDHLNEVGDKRREILHAQARAGKNKRLCDRLSNDLDSLMGKLKGKVRQLAEISNMVVAMPDYFNRYPKLLAR